MEDIENTRVWCVDKLAKRFCLIPWDFFAKNTRRHAKIYNFHIYNMSMIIY